jgi:glycerophosphoryl diester phosphodiesterase
MHSFYWKKPLILAHRCVYPGYPENTLISLRKVIEEGADYVEVDCEFTRDHRIVVSHDSTVDRCTEELGKISEMNFSDLRKLNAAHYLHNIQFQTEPIPLFEEILQILQPTGLRAELHIKNLEVLDAEEYPEENVPDLLIKYGMEERCNINIDILTPAEFLYEFPRFQKLRFTQNAYLDPVSSVDIRYSRLKIILEALQSARFFGLDLSPATIDAKVCQMVHDANLELQCYPTNDIAEMRRLIECGCDVIQTDRMDLLKNIRSSLGY